MGSDSQSAARAGVKESWGKMKVETRVVKWGLRRDQVDLGLILSLVRPSGQAKDN